MVINEGSTQTLKIQKIERKIGLVLRRLAHSMGGLGMRERGQSVNIDSHPSTLPCSR
jgi:hypothetical protein